jgi:alpha-1,2-glucosyltransferase
MLGLGLLSRQTDIIWVLMFTTILFFKHFGSQFKFRNITKFFLLSWPFFVVISGFIVFIVWNKGIALGDTSSHQPGIYFENLFYFLFVNFILFLPIIIRNIKKTLAKATQSFQIKLRIKKINFGASIPIFVLVIALYLYFILRFEVWHHYNQNDYVLHNYLALLLYQNGWCRAGYFIALSLSVFLLFAIPFRQSIYLLTYAFGLALLLLHPMIEHRYYIPIFTLMLMFFKPLGKWPEWSQVFYFIALNVFVTYLCFEHGFVL